MESGGGEGGMLPVWYKWWEHRQAGNSLGWIEREYGADVWYDERSLEKGIEEVERLMRP